MDRTSSVSSFQGLEILLQQQNSLFRIDLDNALVPWIISDEINQRLKRHSVIELVVDGIDQLLELVFGQL